METRPNERDRHHGDVTDYLRTQREALLTAAQDRLEAAPPARYEAAGPDVVAARLRALLDVVTAACSDRRLDAAIAYASGLARARQSDGFRLGEVQAAVNALEEVLWRGIGADLAPNAQADALRVVATVFGVIKDRLGCEYVDGANAAAPGRVDVERLFDGTEANLGAGAL